jgi:hypothetical protein
MVKLRGAVAGSQTTISYTDVNDLAQQWLDANGDPSTVTFDLTAATIDSHTGSSTPAVGDCAGIAASTPTSGLSCWRSRSSSTLAAMTAATGDAAGHGPWTWAVTWGVLARPGFVVEHVQAFDADEALVLAAQRRPDLPRPQVALVVTG